GPLAGGWARTRRSLVPPILMVCRWARPCVIAIRFSVRVSVQRRARPVCLAAQATSSASRSTPILAPNPPPTSGVITRMAPGSSPNAPIMMKREICGFCVLTQTVSLPSCHRPPTPRPSPAVPPPGAGTPPQRPRRDPLVPDGPLHPHVAAVERRRVGGLADGHGDVGRGLGEQQGLARQRRLRAYHGGQGLVVHADQPGRVR